jgi:hypothetical protein
MRVPAPYVGRWSLCGVALGNHAGLRLGGCEHVRYGGADGGADLHKALTALREPQFHPHPHSRLGWVGHDPNTTTNAAPPTASVKTLAPIR